MTQETHNLIHNLLHSEAVFIRGFHNTKRPDYKARFMQAAKDIRAQINELIRGENNNG